MCIMDRLRGSLPNGSFSIPVIQDVPWGRVEAAHLLCVAQPAASGSCLLLSLGPALQPRRLGQVRSLLQGIGRASEVLQDSVDLAMKVAQGFRDSWVVTCEAALLELCGSLGGTTPPMPWTAW